MIEVTKLRKIYPGGVDAVKGIDFEVGTGEVFGLLGPNGAGKSTTIGMLTTTIEPSGGTGRVSGFDVATEARSARRVSGVVFQDSVVDRALTGWQNVETHARLWGVERSAAAGRIERIAGVFGLEELLARPGDSDGMAILLTTHYLDEAERLCDRVAIVHEGRIVALDAPAALLSGLGGELVELRVEGD